MAKERNMNRWQQVYCDTYYEGKMPRTKAGKATFELLGKIKDQITVKFPDFNGLRGFEPAHTETYVVTENECNMPAGKISVSALSVNLPFWLERGYEVTTK